MPNRYLREGILSSERVNKLGPHAEVFYRRLMSLVDDFGRFEANPRLLRAAAFPLRVDEVREADISRWLTEVESAGLIALYAVNGKNYLELHGLGEPRAKSSKFPPPSASANTCAQTQTSAPSSSSSSSSITSSITPSPTVTPSSRARGKQNPSENPSVPPEIPPEIPEEPPGERSAEGIDPANKLADETGLSLNVGPKQRGSLRALISIDGYEAAREAIRFAMDEKGIGGAGAIAYAEKMVAGNRAKRERQATNGSGRNGKGGFIQQSHDRMKERVAKLTGGAQ